MWIQALAGRVLSSNTLKDTGLTSHDCLLAAVDGLASGGHASLPFWFVRTVFGGSEGGFEADDVDI